MNKLSDNSNGLRVFKTIISIFPLLFIIIVFGSIELLATLGYVIFIFSYLTYISFGLYFILFDWDIYCENGALILKRFLTKKKIISKVNTLSVEPIPFFSMALGVFVLKINNSKFIFTARKKSSLFAMIFLQKKYAIENKFKKQFAPVGTH